MDAMLGFDDPSLPLAVVAAATRWEEPPRIRHQVTRQLMRWCNVLFVEFFPDPRHRDRFGFRRHDPRMIADMADPHVSWPIRLYANDPVSHGVVNRRFVADIMAAVAAVRPPGPPLLFNFVYDFHEIMRRTEFAYKAYICYDEFPKMQRRASRPNRLKWLYQSRLFQRYENQVARGADRCFASHQPLVDKLRPFNHRTDLLLHAHEFEAPPAQSHLDAHGRTRVAYMGHITYNLMLPWLDAVLAQPDMELYLIGPVLRFDLERYAAHLGFTHVPPLTGQPLLDKMAEMDVLVMPYDPAIPECHVQTASNKFFQYVAAGRPVVISDMPHYIAMPAGVIYRARTAEEFVETIRRAHAEDCDEFRRLRARIAAENTWDKRGDQLFDTIRRDMGERFPLTRESERETTNHANGSER